MDRSLLDGTEKRGRERMRERAMRERERKRERRTCAAVLEGHGVTLGQSLLQLSQDLLIPVLSEPHHLHQTKTNPYTCHDNGLIML